LQWGAPTFDAGHSVAMMAAVLVSLTEVISSDVFLVSWKVLLHPFSLVQSTAAYKAASRLAIATPPPAYVLSRGIGWQVSWLMGFINNVLILSLIRVSCVRPQSKTLD